METTTTIEADLGPVREQTNVGLGQERATADVVLGHCARNQELGADADLHAERAEADEQTRAERRRSDALVSDNQSSPAQPGAVAAERELANLERGRERLRSDELAATERERADETVRTLRDVSRAMDDSLALERAKTDSLLLAERQMTDEIVDDAGLLLFDEQAAHARSRIAVARRDQLLAMVSHELRSPLTAITLNAQYLLEMAAAAAGTPTHKIAVDVLAACTQMTRLVGDLLELARIDAGKLTVTLALGDANEVMRTAIAASSPMLAAQGLSVIASGPLEPLMAQFDHARLLQVFANLFANAGRFSRLGGKVLVSVRRAGPWLTYCVADSGSGIPAEALPHIFNRFWQVEGGDRRGLGLGLTICKAIVEAHGGRIWASSELGVGSSFFFTLPAAS